jgi:hypothetical protein
MSVGLSSRLLNGCFVMFDDVESEFSVAMRCWDLMHYYALELAI